MQTLWQDLRYSARMLLRQSGFTLIAVSTRAYWIPAWRAMQVDPMIALRCE
ncbi:MAG: hypothetical protein ACREEM_03915 [Blastocatellia bacterium]